jgi:hypothetical protein
MNETSKHEDITAYELDALKEIRDKLSEGQESVRRNDILRGTAFGLILGILGLLFIQSLYPVSQAFLLGQYPPTFTVNVAICAISLISIVCVSVYLYRQLTRCENRPLLSKKSHDVLEYAIKRREHSLEEAKKTLAKR